MSLFFLYSITMVCITLYKKICFKIYLIIVLNCILEYNDDLSTLKLVEVFIKLIQDGLIEMNHLITLLQFVKKVPTQLD